MRIKVTPKESLNVNQEGMSLLKGMRTHLTKLGVIPEKTVILEA